MISTKEAMQEIGQFIIDNLSNNLEVHFSVEQKRTDMNLDDICEGLFEILEETRTTEFKVGNNYDDTKIYTLIYLKYDGRRCEIGEHFGEEKDYFWVKIHPN